MAKEIPTKKSFGTVTIDRFSPSIPPGMPKALNIQVSFEEAMRLHLALGQALAKLNGYDRLTKAGRRSAVRLSIFFDKMRVTVNEGTVKELATSPAAD